MDMEAFIRLTLGDKADLLWRKGIFLENYSDRNYTSNLYFLKDFYVEVVVSHNTYRIREIKAFFTGPRLDKYLQRINLRELIAPAK